MGAIKKTKKAKTKSIKLRFGDNETGWGERLSTNTARVMNIPMEQRFNYGDVVRLEPSTTCRCCMTAGKIVEREYPNKTYVKYPAPYAENWKKLSTALRAAGAMTEGLTYGVGAVAFGHEHDVVAIARATEIEVTVD